MKFEILLIQYNKQNLIWLITLPDFLVLNATIKKCVSRFLVV